MNASSSSLTLPSPQELAAECTPSPAATRAILRHRRAVADIVDGNDRRLLVIVGPCSVHDPAAVLDYARRLAELRQRVRRELLLCLRVYVEKPRTTTGWKGFVHDPALDGSGHVLRGLRESRELMIRVSELGLGIATELLDPILSVYLKDLLSWAAIGARTSESQVHRELASAQPFVIGFKNATDGSSQAAVNAVCAAARPHTTFTIGADGRARMFTSAGNARCHVVLRGGQSGPNYAPEVVRGVGARLAEAGCSRRVMVDCSHGNSEKDYRRQSLVLRSVGAQLRAGSTELLGVMLESHLVEGRQELGRAEPLRYGQSITDACIGFAETEQLLLELAEVHRAARGTMRSQRARRTEQLPALQDSM